MFRLLSDPTTTFIIQPVRTNLPEVRFAASSTARVVQPSSSSSGGGLTATWRPPSLIRRTDERNKMRSTNDGPLEDPARVGSNRPGEQAPRWVWIVLALVVAGALVGGAVAFKLGQSSGDGAGESASAPEWQGSAQLRDLMSKLCSPSSGIACPAPRYTTGISFSDGGYLFGPGSDLNAAFTIPAEQEIASLQFVEELKQISPTGAATEIFYVRGPGWLVETESFSVAQKVQEILGGDLSSYSF